MRRLRHEWQRTRAAPTIPGTSDAEAERSDGPKGCPAPFPSGRAEEHSFRRSRAARCLSRQASLRGPRLKRAPQVAPKGSRTAGSPSLWCLSLGRRAGGDARERYCAAGRTSRHPPLAKAYRQSIEPASATAEFNRFKTSLWRLLALNSPTTWRWKLQMETQGANIPAAPYSTPFKSKLIASSAYP